MVNYYDGDNKFSSFFKENFNLYTSHLSNSDKKKIEKDLEKNDVDTFVKKIHLPSHAKIDSAILFFHEDIKPLIHCYHDLSYIVQKIAEYQRKHEVLPANLQQQLQAIQKLQRYIEERKKDSENWDKLTALYNKMNSDTPLTESKIADYFKELESYPQNPEWVFSSGFAFAVRQHLKMASEELTREKEERALEDRIKNKTASLSELLNLLLRKESKTSKLTKKQRAFFDQAQSKAEYLRVRANEMKGYVTNEEIEKVKNLKELHEINIKLEEIAQDIARTAGAHLPNKEAFPKEWQNLLKIARLFDIPDLSQVAKEIKAKMDVKRITLEAAAAIEKAELKKIFATIKLPAVPLIRPENSTKEAVDRAIKKAADAYLKMQSIHISPEEFKTELKNLLQTEIERIAAESSRLNTALDLGKMKKLVLDKVDAYPL